MAAGPGGTITAAATDRKSINGLNAVVDVKRLALRPRHHPGAGTGCELRRRVRRSPRNDLRSIDVAQSEMVVPYGSPDRAHARKNVFDIGEYGLGKLANSLKLGCDCPGAIHYPGAPGPGGCPGYFQNTTGCTRRSVLQWVAPPRTP